MIKRIRLISKITESGCSLKTVSQLTGIPLWDVIRHYSLQQLPTPSQFLKYSSFLRVPVAVLIQQEEV